MAVLIIQQLLLMSLVRRPTTIVLSLPVRLGVDMAFDWLRFAKSGPTGPTRDARGQHHHQRPPPMITRVHGKRPAPVPQAVPQVRRGHHRDQHQSSSAPVPRAPATVRKGPVVRGPARPHPPQRGTSKLLQCLHIHFHPSQKRDLAHPPSRSSKYISSKHISSQQVPPFPPPRGAVKPPRRHVHWAPAQAPLPHQPYPYPSHSSSSASSRAHSHARTMHYQIPMAIPRYQPPRTSSGSTHPPHRRK